MYLLHLNIKITKVTCPGVWLCPKGTVMLKMNLLQQSKKTRKISPRFPLNFCDTLTFQKVVTDDVESIADILENEKIAIELIQWTAFDSKFGIVLAKYEQYLCNIFEPFVIERRVNEIANTDLLLPKTEYFPGIISPKASVVFQLRVESNRRSAKMFGVASPDACCNRYPRQRTVCHSGLHSGCDCSHRVNSDCSICSLSFDIHKKYEKLRSRRNYLETRNDQECPWCNDSVPSYCKCCCYLNQNSIFY